MYLIELYNKLMHIYRMFQTLYTEMPEKRSQCHHTPEELMMDLIHENFIELMRIEEE